MIEAQHGRPFRLWQVLSGLHDTDRALATSTCPFRLEFEGPSIEASYIDPYQDGEEGLRGSRWQLMLPLGLRTITLLSFGRQL